MPNVEYVAPWFPEEAINKTMPFEIWESLSPHARKLCRFARAKRGVWPPGAGVMHPLARKREEASAE